MSKSEQPVKAFTKSEGFRKAWGNQAKDNINEQFCKDCQYAKKLELSETNEPFHAFHCCRRAPIACKNPFDRWPIVISDDWCGEFELRKKPVSEEEAELNAERGRICDAEGKPLWEEDEQQPTSDAVELAKKALRKVEWCIGGDDRYIEGKLEQWSCPICNWGEKDGHSPDCIVGEALDALEKEERSVKESSGKWFTTSLNEDDLIESLAELEHEQWAHWARYMLKNLDLSHITHWERQIITPYSELSEKEKESDRVWARKMLEVIRAAKTKDEADAKQQDWEATAWFMVQPLVVQNRENIQREIRRLKQGGGETWAMGEVMWIIGEVIERALTVLDIFKESRGVVEVTE